MDDDLEALREELAAARAEAARLAERLADREARAAELEETAAGLRRELARAHDGRRAAVARYREALAAAAPELPAELLAGDTVEAVDEAARRARELVARVREHLSAAESARPVPAGSPPRRGPDVAALSPAEKIRYGLAER
jgi:chromosome segregation ATPase